MTVDSVTTYVKALRGLLRTAHDIKPSAGIEPALTISDLGDAINNIGKQPGDDPLAPKSSHYLSVETASREIFYGLVATTPIHDPAFDEVWNLLDIITIISDIGKCEPGLVLWLVEELLDTQTIDGCRIIFDYLDSRRERIIAKHFKSKQLIIQRACNELLRRLSRAEDTVFCGRVFIFMFQSFPLADRSSVNLRGEYHVENVTTYEDIPAKPALDQAEAMELGAKGEGGDAVKGETTSDEPTAEQSGKAEPNPAEPPNKSVTSEEKTKNDPLEPSMDELYPVFWSLQASFSNPTRLFEEDNFHEFKHGLRLTMNKLRSVHQDLQGRGSSRVVDEGQHGTKRKRGDDSSELASSFNPKYLTSRDLFELEVSDLAFRRHVLVQALILMNFLLSLSPKAKKKLEDKKNTSILYSYTLSEVDIQWAIQMKSDIAAYLQQGPEGKFYYRMIDTVLTRDKNWTHWKAENCPLIDRAPVAAEQYREAAKGAQTACINKRLKVTPLGSLDLGFLSEGSSAYGFRQLAKPERYTLPAVDSFKGPIADDDFDIDMAQNEEEKQQVRDARASKLWRTLRVASKNRLNMLDKVDDGQNLQAFFDSTGNENHVPLENTDAQPPDGDKKDTDESNGIKTFVQDETASANVEVNGIKDAKDEGASSELAPGIEILEHTPEIPQEGVVT